MKNAKMNKTKSCHYCNHLRQQHFNVWCKKNHLDGMIELKPKEKSTLYQRMETYQGLARIHDRPVQAQVFLDTAAKCKDYDDEL